ncbi:DUF7144 family membrane protein [Streptomyces sp. NPDC002845]
MSQPPTTTPPPPPSPHVTRPKGASWATGGTVFAGVLMLVSGIIGILNGIAGIAADDVYEPIGDYVFKFSLTAWGWIHLVVGLLVAATGWGILQAKDWARAVGLTLAALYLIEYFLFLPFAPVWSVISIAIAVFVMWSLATAPTDPKAPR